MILSHFRQKEWPRTRKRKLTATVSKPPSDNEKIQVLADVHAAQEHLHQSHRHHIQLHKVLVPFQRGRQGQVQVQAKVQVVTVTAQ